ncbi:hypothetical protein EJB05_22793, partial [Eragrostis curvula]
MASPAPPPPDPAVPARPKTLTVYMSPLCPELRTRAWIEFLGFPRNLWFKRAANGCLSSFGGVTHFDAAELRRSGRMVVEARVTRVAEVPKRVFVFESGVPGLPNHFLRHDVRLVVLAAEPVFDEEGSTGNRRSAVSAAELGESQVDNEERPEFVKCFLSRNERLWD